MTKVLVTGGAGFIGSHLVDRLVRHGSQVVVLDNMRRGKRANLSKSAGQVVVIEGDIRQRETVERAVENVDVVYHLAAQSNVLGAVADLDYSFSTNVTGTFEVLRAAAKAGAKRLVFTSSREVYGDPRTLPVSEGAELAPKNAYGASKAAGEMYCRVLSTSSFKPMILRLANVYGPRDFDRVIPIFVDQALKNEPLTLFGGKQILDFIWIDNVIDSLVKAAEMTSLSGPVNVGSGKPTELLKLAERVIEATNSRSELNVVAERAVEVGRYVADITVQKTVLKSEPPAEPLGHLEEMVRFVQSSR